MNCGSGALASLTLPRGYPRLDVLAERVARRDGTPQQARLVLRALTSVRAYRACLDLANEIADVTGFERHALSEQILATSSADDGPGIEAILDRLIGNGDPADNALISACLRSLIDLGRYDAAEARIADLPPGLMDVDARRLMRSRLLLLSERFQDAEDEMSRLSASPDLKAYVEVGLVEIGMRRKIDCFNKTSDKKEDDWLRFFKDLGETISYRHNYIMNSGKILFDFAKIRSHTPAGVPDFNFEEWCQISHHIPSWQGQRVIDIGAADGFFSVEVAKAGANVVYLEPHRGPADRARSIFEYFGVSDRITIDTGYFSERTVARYAKVDIALALGLIYHLDNILHTMHLLTAMADTLVIEASCNDNADFTDIDAINFRANETVSHPWLRGFLERQGYAVHDLDAWRAFCLPHRQTRDRRLFIATRQS